MTPSDRYLAAVRFLGMLWTQGTSGMDPADFVRTFEYYLDAFAELEVMGTDETELWRHRMRVALSDDGRPLFEWAAPVRERLERAVRELPVRVEAMDDEAQRLFAVLGAVQPLRALPEDKTHAWALRQSTRIAPPSGSRPPVDERRQRMTLAWANAVPGKLLRVVPGPPERRAGLRVASVQLYEGAASVRWHFVSKDESWPKTASYPSCHLELADDRGTEYLGKGGGGSRMGTTPAGEAVVIGQDDFVPAPPGLARSLTIGYAGQEVSVELRPAQR